MAEFSSQINTGKAIAAEVSEKNVTFMAAGIAYNAFISIAPILAILLVVVSAVGGGLEQQLVTLARESLPGPIADVVAQVFQGGAADPAASIVGLVVLVWGTLKLFRGLDTAFSEIYETTAKNSFSDKLVDGLVVFVVVVIAVVITVGVTALFSALSDVIPYVGLLTPLLLVGGLLIAFLPMYYRFPDTDLGWREVLPGAAFAAIGWAAFQAVFQVYLVFSGGGSDSLFGGIIVVITWLYFSGLVLLLGGVINAVLGGHASGKAGGVGRGASEYETQREETMSCDEFAGYLTELREGLTGRCEEMRPTDSADVADRQPVPTSGITVIEQSKPDGDEQEWSVAFRWRTTAAESDSQPGSSGG
jgi:membrane protein